jgi:hypothetical protein
MQQPACMKPEMKALRRENPRGQAVESPAVSGEGRAKPPSAGSVRDARPTEKNMPPDEGTQPAAIATAS